MPPPCLVHAANDSPNASSVPKVPNDRMSLPLIESANMAIIAPFRHRIRECGTFSVVRTDLRPCSAFQASLATPVHFRGPPAHHGHECESRNEDRPMIGIIHMGAAKTGSSTLQECFHLNRERLREAGVFYPCSPGAKQHGLLAESCIDPAREPDGEAAERRNRGFRESFAREMAHDAIGMDYLLVSSELFHARLWDAGEIERLKALLEPWCSSWRVVFYMRRQDRYATSLHSTYLRRGGESDATLDVLNPHHFMYAHILQLWSGVFGAGAMVPRVFERGALVGGDIVADFVAASGLPLAPGQCKRPADRNAALSADAQWFLREFNRRRSRSVDAMADDEARLRRHVADFLATHRAGTPALPARDAARAFYAGYREANAEVARSWFGRESLFDESFDDYPETPSDAMPSADDAMDVAAPLLREISANSLWLDEDRRKRLANAKSTAALLAILAGYLEECDPALAQRIRSA
jgi:hypothetical protein